MRRLAGKAGLLFNSYVQHNNATTLPNKLQVITSMYAAQRGLASYCTTLVEMW
jgi:hypothetical protein